MGKLSETVGNSGEQIAESYLKKNSFKFTCRNYHSCYGEIDMIFSDEHFIVFVEVKLRKVGCIANALEYVSRSKQKKIIKTAYEYIAKNNIKIQPRFDVIEIVNCNKEFKINHIKNAFG
ncbi:MAG: YraN family protein [Candidatus Paraimprobicoccus trichonymphae]|uniref:UPF0102 protein RsTaC01_0754 n=1 Tax=Candidatus Paraimprobicoccus trichonymphae TaxID=3033793 RepID=A0AA48I6B0_9FIRM|nr:MAG: YraN family protein [Candidatus Paraimprobicoccus trichonymphae]